MELRTGIDIIEIERMRLAVERSGKRFLDRVFTAQEQADCKGRMDSLAARFAVKEAVAKALGTGFGQIGWCDVEIVRGPRREPYLQLHGRAESISRQLGLSKWSISMSHTQSYAVAMAVAMGE